MKEDRISQRIAIELPGQFCFTDKPNKWVKADVMNLSTHGFCFRTSAKNVADLDTKPLIQLGFALTDDEDVILDIQVIWVGKTSEVNCLVGGEILDPSGADYQRILDFYTRIFRERS